MQLFMNKLTFLVNYIKRKVLKEENMKTLQIIALILTIVGALNWGLIGLFDFDLVASIFGGASTTGTRLIYSLVGLAGIINIGLLFELFEKLDNRK